MLAPGRIHLMRIITRRIYRAFPVLDRFPDDQCRAIVRRVASRKLIVLVVMIGAALAFVACLAVMIYLWAYHGSRATRFAEYLELHLGGTTGSGLFGVILIVGTFAPPCFASLLTRDVILSLLVKRQLKNFLRIRQCPACSYLLIGAPVTDDRVKCAECGEGWSLSQLGLSSADDLRVDSTG